LGRHGESFRFQGFHGNEAASPAEQAHALMSVGRNGAHRFATTHWTAVLTARDGEENQAREALGRLCETYWYALYAYLRGRGFSPPDAEDLTQSFLASLMVRTSLARVHPSHGRFRSFLLACLNHFVADQLDKQKRQKRGGDRQIISIDAPGAETRYALEPAGELDPQKIFERRWALTVIEITLQRLERETMAAGKQHWFLHLKPALIGDRLPAGYAEVGQLLGLSEGAVKVAIHRLRQRFRVLFREQIAQTVRHASEIEEEVRFLFRALSS
jgi:RNA polymerase sigma-70 factor (ECF subfamily)